MLLTCPAKINRFLHIIGQRADGYHEIETLFQFIELADTLHFEMLPQPHITRIDQHKFKLPQEDLTIRAAKLLQTTSRRAATCGVRITMHKVIPPGSGLGGGSSNAASTLLALNHLWQLGLSRSKLVTLSRQLGADVPLFVRGRAALAGGIGERLSRPAAHTVPLQWLCLCVPSVQVSTATVFAQLPPTGTVRNCQPLANHNQLQAITTALYPEVATALTCLSQYGAAQMSGSGGAVYAPFDSHQQAVHATTQLSKQLPASFSCLVTRTTNRHPLLNFP